MWSRARPILEFICPLFVAFSAVGVIWVDRTILLLTDAGAAHRSPVEGYILPAGVDGLWLELSFSIFVVAMLRLKAFNVATSLIRSLIALVAIVAFCLALRWLR